MALNKANDAIIERRRQVVASLLLRRMTRREIVDALEKQGLRNPDSGEPFSLATVQSDVMALEKQWRKDSARTIETHKALMLAELQEVKRASWAKGQIANVLRALKQESELLGLDAALRIKLDVTDWRSLAIADIRAGKLPYSVLEEVFDHDLASELFRAAGVPVTR